MARSESTTTQEIMKAIRAELDRTEAATLSPNAARSRQGMRRGHEPFLSTGYRQPFAVDVDRILHSHAYARYIDKTQVFYLVNNDHITHRVLHVQLVSKIARTIGRFLALNEDLIEAISLGHDIGHTPFGHDGERFLSRLCRQAGIGHFLHNLQGVQFLERVERRGAGWNLCLQTLDGILCHDGEVHDQALTPQREKTFDTLDRELIRKKAEPAIVLTPMTMEGCVVRLADTIAYIGRDIEDAIRLRIIRRSDLPARCAQILGTTNGTIVHTLVTDVIANSYGKPYVTFSREISDALKDLKQFNLQYIYLNPDIKPHTETIGKLFDHLFNRYCRDLRERILDAPIYTDFLSDKSEIYVQVHRPEEIVRDYISGMTDRYFLRQCPADLRPEAMAV